MAKKERGGFMTSNGERKLALLENMKGGRGTVTIERLLKEPKLNGKCKMYARVIVAPGSSIGYHEHQGDSETYFILSGKGVYNDNHEKLLEVKPGDCTYTASGRGHSLENTGTEDLTLMALIIALE